MDDARILATLREWVETESPTQHAAGVNRVADLAERDLRAMGAAIERRPGREGMGDILLARLPGMQDGPGLLLLGHLDTVHPLGTLAGPLPFRVADGRAYGPGIYDMKAGSVMALSALAWLHARGERPLLPVTVMLIPDEELGSPTSRAAIEEQARNHAAVLVFEPSGEGGKLTVARHGIARWHLRARGRSAHAGAYHADGVSAVRIMAQAVLALEALTDHARNFCVNIGTIAGGTHENMVPAECTAICYALVPTAREAQELAAAIAALPVEAAAGLGRPPYGKTPAIQAMFAHAARLAAGSAFPVAGERVAGGGSDGNFTGALGVPTLDGLGAIGAGPHTLEEHVLTACLAPRTRMIAELLRSLNPP